MVACTERFADRLWEAAETDTLPDDLQAHLTACPYCRDEWALAQSALRGFASLRVAPAPTRELRLPERPQLFQWPMLRVAIACAALVILLLTLALAGWRKPRVQMAMPPVTVTPPLRQLHLSHSIGTIARRTRPAAAQTQRQLAALVMLPHRRRHHYPGIAHRMVMHQESAPSPSEMPALTLPELAQVPVAAGMVTPLSSIGVDTTMPINCGQVCRLADLPLATDAVLPASEAQVRELESVVGARKSD